MGIGCFNDHPVWMTVGMGDDGGNYAQMASMQTGELLWFIKIVWLGVCDIFMFFPTTQKGWLVEMTSTFVDGLRLRISSTNHNP